MDLLRMLPPKPLGGLKRLLRITLTIGLAVLGAEGHANQERSAPGLEHVPAAARPPGLHACPVETMSCYPGCAQVGELYACGAQLIALAGGLTAAIIAVAEAEDTSVEDFCKKHAVLCSKGGVQNKENEYVREATRRPDPCGWLQEQYGEATGSERDKIRLAQKYLGCRNKQKRKT